MTTRCTMKADPVSMVATSAPHCQMSLQRKGRFFAEIFGQGGQRFRNRAVLTSPGSAEQKA